jgi:hypothetical protein
VISRTYGQGAKCFISLGEIKPVDFTGFPFRQDPKAFAREIDGRVLARAANVARLRPSATREWRHKSLKSPKMDSGMAPRFGVALRMGIDYPNSYESF